MEGQVIQVTLERKHQSINEHKLKNQLIDHSINEIGNQLMN